MVFLLATSFLYATVAVYSIGYLAPGMAMTRPPTTHGGSPGLNLFAWSMLAAPLMSNLALLWVAVEVTTVISALLVAIEATDRAAEAAWKYLLIASAGLSIALLGTIFMYYAGAQVLGLHYNLASGRCCTAPPGCRTPRPDGVRAGGAGLRHQGRPVPGAHLAAGCALRSTTPVSALLSGSLLAVSFYAILRYYQVAVVALGPRFPRDVLLVFGVATLLLAALYLLDQRDYKRLLAYSSMEHMGILAIGVSFGAPIALAGVLLHVLAHAAAKGNAFMGSGVLLRKFGSKQISAPAAAWTCCPGAARCSWPPSWRCARCRRSGSSAASSRSSAAGWPRRPTARGDPGRLVTVAFLGLALAANRMLLSWPRPAPARRTAAADAGRAQRLDGRARRRGLLALLVLGLHPPGELTGLLARAVSQLGGTS